MRIFFFILLGISFFLKSEATTLDSVSIHLRIDATKNCLHVTETYHLPPNQIMPPWERIMFHKGIVGYPLLSQRLENIVLKDKEGKVLTLEQDGYGQERTRLGFLKKDLKGSTQLSYTMLFPFDGTADFFLELDFYDFQVTTNQINLILEIPFAIKLKNNSWDINCYDGSKQGEFEFQNKLKMSEITPDSQRQTLENTSAIYELKIHQKEGNAGIFDPVLKGTFAFEEALLLEAPYSYKSEWKMQGEGLIWLVIIALLIAIILRFFPPATYLIAIRIYGLLVFVLMIYTIYPLVAYYQKKEISDNFVMELGVHFIFIGAFVLIARDLHRNLLQQNSKAYYGVLGFPALLLYLIGFGFVNPIIFVLLPLAFSPLFFWFQAKNANYLGATYYHLVEQVETAGKLSFDELSKKSQLSVQRLIHIIKNIPHHPVLIDHEQRIFMMANAVEFQQKHQLCTNCGAATITENEDLVNCTYCHTSYRDNYKKEVTKPIPEIVEIAAQIIQNMAYVLYLFCLAIVFVGFVMMYFTNFSDFIIDIIVVVIFVSIFGKIGSILSEGAERMRSGKGDQIKFLLIPLFVFISPIFIYYKLLRSKRIQLHFNEYAIEGIDLFIEKEGTVSLPQLAKYLAISTKEALEIADYLCGNNLIEVVFDVHKNQLVHRTLWQKLKGANSCNSCGGLIRIKNNETECMHCGEQN